MKISDLILNKVNKDYFLPSIQREFVWMDNPALKKVETLFDSIMQEYPIGTLLVWEINKKGPNEDIKCEVYKFADKYDKDNPYNAVANHNGYLQLHLILDGQQRLTALNIGLKGSYLFKRYGKPKEKKLFLNLFSNIKDDINNNYGYQYEFQFFDNIPDDPNTLWFEVGQVLNYHDQSDDKFIEEYSTIINNKTKDKDKIKKAESILRQLFNVICKKENVLPEQTYRTEDDERVLNIFVRTNDGGTKLEKADLLLSYMESNKTFFIPNGAKKEITNFVKSLNEVTEQKPNYNFDKDDILKSCLVLSELDIQYRLKNFNDYNLAVISNKWTEIEKAISLTRDLISYYGFTSKSIISKNSLIPIEYIFMKKRYGSSFVASKEKENVRFKNKIIRWWTIAQLTGEFGNSSDTTLRKYREMLKEEDAYEVLEKQNKMEKDDIQDWLNNEKYNSKYAHLILMLLNNNNYWERSHVDHLFPHSLFKQEVYNKIKLSDEQVKFYNDNCNSIANLCIINDSVNRTKSDQELESWVEKQNDEYKKSAMVDELDLQFINFEKFIEERKNRMKKRLLEILS